MSITLPNSLDEMKQIPHWVAWKTTIQDNEPKKPAINPHTGKFASPIDATTWATFDETAAFAARKGYTDNRISGIGFELGITPCGYACVDIDECISSDGELTDMAGEIVRVMDSYTEYSPSGSGLHIWCRLSMPMSKIGNRVRNDNIGLEIYDRKRYMTVTGKVYGEMRPIAERTKEIQQIYGKYMVELEKAKATEPPPTVDNRKTGTKPQGTQKRPENMTDDELWERMFASQNGHKIRALYNGDITGYTQVHKDGKVHDNHSGADVALCSILYWWTKDTARVDRMFRQSQLYRPKWDEMHGEQTYGAGTIARAMSNEYYPQELPAQNGHVPEQTAVMTEQSGGKSETEKDNQVSTVVVAQDFILPITSYDYVHDGEFQKELYEFQNLPSILSGFDNFDKEQGGLVPGLYALGATPSLGKTTFMSQIADNIAKNGNHVLFFSLEQSRLELVTKSLSRITAQLKGDYAEKYAVSSINIRRDNMSSAQRKLVEQAKAEYQTFSRNITIVQCGFDTTVSNIAETAERFIEHTGIKPVVIVDYLQLVQPEKDERNIRDNVESVIRKMKTLQRDNNLILFVVSSFNRANYTTGVGFESFKESGLIEYSCDVVLGMQPTVMITDNVFLKEKAGREQRNAMDKAIDAIPRKVMLKNLKNRYGRSQYSCGFDYHCTFDYFVPDKDFKEKSNDKRTVL